MRDDLPRLLSPPTLPNGLPNPAHMEKPVYLWRARVGRAMPRRGRTRSGSAGSGSRSRTLLAFAPVRVRAAVLGELARGGTRAGRSWPRRSPKRRRRRRSAGSMPAIAGGGGYSGPLVYRQRRGHAPRRRRGLRPDGGGGRRARDRRSSSARAFAPTPNRPRSSPRNPTRRWVAPPGQSLHRCATELDLGPDVRLRLAGRQRAPASASSSATPGSPGISASTAARRPARTAGDAVGAAEAGGATARSRRRRPARLRPGPLPGAAAARRGALERLRRAARRAADGRVELQPLRGLAGGRPGHRPVHPVDGGRLRPRDPFDPDAAIDAQAHLMSDLLRQFGSPQLALAAYNAGPGAGRSLRLRPPYPRDRRLRQPASSPCSTAPAPWLAAGVRGAAGGVIRWRRSNALSQCAALASAATVW